MQTSGKALSQYWAVLGHICPPASRCWALEEIRLHPPTILARDAIATEAIHPQLQTSLEF